MNLRGLLDGITIDKMWARTVRAGKNSTVVRGSGITFDEQSSQPSDPGAGKGLYYVEDDVPSSFNYLDDDGSTALLAELSGGFTWSIATELGSDGKLSIAIPPAGGQSAGQILVIFNLQDDAAASTVKLAEMTFNDASHTRGGSSYTTQVAYLSQAPAYAGVGEDGESQPEIYIGYIPDTGLASAASFSSGWMWIINPFDTSTHTIIYGQMFSQAADGANTTHMRISWFGAAWHDTSLVETVQFTSLANANLEVGSRVDLYGIK